MKNILIAFVLGMCFFSFNERINGQTDSERLRNVKITIKAEKAELKWVLGYLVNFYDIPFGFENSLLDDSHTDFLMEVNKYYQPKYYNLPRSGGWIVRERFFNLDFNNEPLPVVLDEIARQAENYKWEIDDGVVNFTPTKERSEIYQGLLDLKISKFSSESAMISSVREKVLKLEEVRRYLKEVKAETISTHPYPQYATRILSQEMEFSDITMRELLNKIVKVKRGGWLVRGDYVFDTPKTGIHWVLLQF